MVKQGETMKLHIGGGYHRIEGFLNVDIQKRGDNTDIISDAVSLPVKSNSVEEVYASHILEHFYHTDTLKVLTEWNRVLKPGGKLWVSVPDFEIVIGVYRDVGYMCDWVRNMLYGDQKEDKYTTVHRTCFTFASLCKVMKDAGFDNFEDIAEMPYGLKDNSHYKVSGAAMGSSGKLISVNVKAIKSN